MGLWGTGVVAVMIACSLGGLYRQQQTRRALLLVSTFAGGILMSSFYTLPALLEKKFVRTETMVVAWAAPQNNPLAWPALFERGPHQVGPLIALASLVAVGGYVLRRRMAGQALLWLVGSITLTLLTLPLASPLWEANVIPFGAFIQFPWRLIGPASLCAAVALGIGWAHAFPARLVARLLAIPVLLVGVSLAVPHISFEPMKADKVLLSTGRIGSGWVRGTVLDEYLPRVVAQTTATPARRVARARAPACHPVDARYAHELRSTRQRRASWSSSCTGFPVVCRHAGGPAASPVRERQGY